MALNPGDVGRGTVERLAARALLCAWGRAAAEAFRLCHGHFGAGVSQAGKEGRWAAGGGRAECSCLCPTRSQVRGSHTSLAWQQFGASPFLSAAQNAVCFVCEAMRAWATVSSCKPLSPTELTP